MQVGNAFGDFHQSGTESPTISATLSLIKAGLDPSYEDSTLTYDYFNTLENGNKIYKWYSIENPDGAPAGYIEHNPCGGLSGSFCNPSEEDILLNGGMWPSDGCTNLAIKGGKIVGSKYDPDQDGSYSKPMSEIQLCSGTDQISLAPSADGGWKTINSTTDSGYLYDSSGRQIAHIDGNEYSDPSV